MYKLALACGALALMAQGATARSSRGPAAADFDSGFVWKCEDQRESIEINATSIAVDNVCQACLCAAMSGCDGDIGCTKDPTARARRKREKCGPFQITESFWRLYNSAQPESDFSKAARDTFKACANDFFCSSRVVQNYLNKNTCDKWIPERVYDHTTKSQCELHMLNLKVGADYRNEAQRKKTTAAMEDPNWTQCVANLGLEDVEGKLAV